MRSASAARATRVSTSLSSRPGGRTSNESDAIAMGDEHPVSETRVKASAKAVVPPAELSRSMVDALADILRDETR